MKVQYRTETKADEKIMKGIDLSLSPIEAMLFHRALLMFTRKSENETDRIRALQMMNEYEDAWSGEFQQSEVVPDCGWK